MATVFMKWLEQSPGAYDRGIELLTLGRLRPIKERIAAEMVRPGDRVLEIGCGTGTLALLMAQRGAQVTGVDASGLMLEEARQKVVTAGKQQQVALLELDAVQLRDKFEPGSFDLIVATLLFSELYEEQRRFVLAECETLLAENGRLVIVDEVVPQRFLSRLLYTLIRIPLVLITWLLTRTTTHPLRELVDEVDQAGFAVETAESYLGGSLQLLHVVRVEEFEVVPSKNAENGIETCCLPCMIQSIAAGDSAEMAPAVGIVDRLRYTLNLRTLFIDIWTLFFRMIPPYPKVQPGLYTIGEPGPNAPVLVTGNFEVTVRRLVNAIDGINDVWLLVADSGGINVWCAAGGGHFTAEKIIAVLKTSRLAEIVNHHALILPQLAANGVDGWKIRQETGWGVHWGPVRAADIPAYLGARRRKSERMRLVAFPLKDRLEMTVVMWAFYVILLAVVVFIFWRPYFWPAIVIMTVLSFLYGVFLPWIPGHDGLAKGAVLAGLTVGGVLLVYYFLDDWSAQQLWGWILGLGFLAFFTGSEFQGMSPLMRGEQANWGIEAVVGVVVLAVYYLPKFAGWWGI